MAEATKTGGKPAEGEAKGGKPAASKPRKENRPAHVIVAEKISSMGLDALDGLAAELVKNSPRGAKFLHDSIAEAAQAAERPSA